jgi:hypothetical protein
MIILECKLVRFLSELDELSFDERIQKISCIEFSKGLGDTLFLKIKSKNISDRCLRELISLFYRYKINMTQLAVFLNEKNKHWFLDQKAFWFKKTFNKKEKEK